MKFKNLTNKAKRKVYKEINKRYAGNNISKKEPFCFEKHVPIMAEVFFNSYPFLFKNQKLKEIKKPKKV